MADVEMKPADKAAKSKEQEEKKEEKKELPPTPLQEIRANLALIERGVSTLEPRFTNRVLRTLTSLRKKITDAVLLEVIEDVYAKVHGGDCVDATTKQALLSWLPPSSGEAIMEVDASAPASTAAKPQPLDLVPESEIYVRLLLIHHLLAAPATYSKALNLAKETAQKIQALNRRSMDPIAAKVWYAVERAYELTGDLAGARPLFLAAQRTASLRQDSETLASLINRLLRSYVHYSLYDQADKLASKTTFPASAGNVQFARYHYYLGRIRAVQLNYSDAHANLQQAIRRAPPAKTAPGFYQAVHKLSVVVELLMGDIPERGLFRHPVLEKALGAYFDIVKAVRAGSLSQFQTTLQTHAARFEEDKTYTLVLRLRQNVIKTGIRRLSLSYSRISLRDICVKLHLDSEEDAEYIVGKAIRDGVIEGRIVHEKGWMECRGEKRGYGAEVGEAFSRRIGVCLELHNQSVKAMRYPLNAHRKELAAAEGAREREKELAKELQQGDDLDDDDMDDMADD
ncbi:PCI-domain-containing protein [Punctularia strigosozonata HHB-11173 SS5]|uniref:PCI-domain-containing protein n=1 Tax=Punctularia strigosozonata (strain HHB-11173) TaxID=741275 RepID=UPI0004418421|nr:PCI-domain-containing protein [Punctularia strigosozonata HHB-11173 SS5]EIN08413.1 PCI-domain-containing protein [Punctularia strigosozonata HHB-11173 SS5]